MTDHTRHKSDWIVALADKGCDAPEIAAKVGCNPTAVYAVLSDKGLPTPKQAARDMRNKAMIQCARAGWTTAEIAVEFGLSIPQVATIVENKRKQAGKRYLARVTLPDGRGIILQASRSKIAAMARQLAGVVAMSWLDSVTPDELLDLIHRQTQSEE